MTQAIRFYETGGADVLKLETVDVGEPGPGQARTISRPTSPVAPASSASSWNAMNPLLSGWAQNTRPGGMSF